MADKKHTGLCAVFGAAVLLASFSQSYAEDKFSAGEMLDTCKAVLDTAKTAKSEDELDLENTFASGTCWGAFLSIQQFMVMKMDGGKSPILNLCVPPSMTLVHIVQIFDLFVRSNPKRADEPFTKVAIAAMRSAFPCP